MPKFYNNLILSIQQQDFNNQMAITKKTTHRRQKTRLLTKKQKAYKRVAHIKKVLQTKKRAKVLSKKHKTSVKRKQLNEAEDQNIQLQPPKQDNYQSGTIQQQINILDILGLTEHNSSQSWEAKLEQKLKEVNSKSLDNPQVRRVYGQIGKIFGTYRSGKIPKAFKVIPNLQKWKEVLQITHPQKWTPQAMYQAVNIFASNFDPVRAQQFYRHYLVRAIRQDLQKNKKLNYHYYESLKKGLYKTNAWFKGILFEFCGKNASIKQIKVIQSLLMKMSIPVISSSVALIKMTQMQPSTATFHYLKVLVNKNYSFPKKVLVILSNYMLKFQHMPQQMPVIWHQLFLSIIKQYGNSFDQMNKASLVNLAKARSHKLITPEILTLLN